MKDDDAFLLKQSMSEFAQEVRNTVFESLIPTIESIGKQDALSAGIGLKMKDLLEQLSIEDVVTIGQTSDHINSLIIESEEGVIVTPKILADIYNSLKESIIGVLFGKLAASGALECGWNEETGEMEFWE